MDEIVESTLSNFSEYDPADPEDPTAWHFTDDEVRSLLLLAIEKTEERLLDPVQVGRLIGGMKP